MPTPSPHHRHQTSLEGVIDVFAPHPALSFDQRQQETSVFTAVIEACEPRQNHKPYKQVTLVRLTYEYARSEASRDNFLRFFFQHTQIPTKPTQSESATLSDYGPRLIAFAETLIENFFLPCKRIRTVFEIDVS
jgi:hypothetical protein